MKITIKREQNNKTFEVALKNLDGKQAKVGWFKESRYKDGTPVASVAIANEFGVPTRNVPARPFMRPTVIQEKNNWMKIAEQGAKQILKGSGTIEYVLEIIGQTARFDIQKKIASIWSPPLKQSTIDNRLRRYSKKTQTHSIEKPLIDTSLMFTSITNIVENTENGEK